VDLQDEAVLARDAVTFGDLRNRRRELVVSLGVVLAGMNSLFYLAIEQLPLSTVGAIEFLGPIGLAALGARSARNILALIVAIAGVYILTDVRIEGAPLGYVFAFANCALFVVYIVLGHRISGAGGIDRLGVSMLIAMVAPSTCHTTSSVSRLSAASASPRPKASKYA